MTNQQKYWHALLYVDEQGEGLEPEEIDFVANLIDGDREGVLTTAEMSVIRGLLNHRTEGWAALNNYLSTRIIERNG